MVRLTPTVVYRRYLQSSDPGRLPVPWGWGFILGCVVILFALVFPIFAFFDYLDSTHHTPVSRFYLDTGAHFSVTGLVALTVIWAVCKGGYNIDIEHFLGLVPLSLRLILPAMACGAAIAVVVCLAYLQFTDTGSYVHSLGYRLGAGVPVTIRFLLTEFVTRYFFGAALIGPLVEELYRVLLYSWLRRHLNCGASLLVTSLLYALLHGWGTMTVAHLIVGLACGYAYERTRCLLSPYVLHGSYNLSIVLVDPAARQWLFH